MNKRNCPKCGKEKIYNNRSNLLYAIRHNSLCAICCQDGKIMSDEAKKNISKALIGNKHNLGKIASQETLQKLSLLHKGKKRSEETRTKIGLGNKGKIVSEETKKNMRIAKLKRFEMLGIGAKEDVGAKEWIEKYNKENNVNFHPKRFLDIGYDADGYDENLHSWIEFDTPYHKGINQKKRDLIRQQNIIKYFEEMGEPLVEFKRFLTWENKLETVYRGYEYV